MTRKTIDATVLLRSVCALFMLVCILFFILPYAHNCTGEDCPLCMLKNVFSEIILAVCFFGVLPVLVCSVEPFIFSLEQSAPQTLVHLKVKLSD